jgi:hypothetical protein
MLIVFSRATGPANTLPSNAFVELLQLAMMPLQAVIFRQLLLAEHKHGDGRLPDEVSGGNELQLCDRRVKPQAENGLRVQGFEDLFSGVESSMLVQHWDLGLRKQILERVE